MSWDLDESINLPGGTLTIYQMPMPRVNYCAGIDFAYGLADSDADCCIILDEYGDQVAELHGWWGNTAFLTHLRPLLSLFQPFIVGERQVGLDMLRTLFDEGFWVYFQIDEEKKGRTRRDLIGHHASHLDRVILRLRRALATQKPDGTLRTPLIRVRSEECIGELASYQFLPRSGQTLDGARDEDLSMGAPPGELDDRVRALGYAWMGIKEIPKYEKPPPVFPKGSLGDQLGHSDVLNPTTEQVPLLLRRPKPR